ncbi:MAG: MFS transporter [Thermoguttaceae bacterium]
MRSIRWPIAILITVAVAIGYLDRQTLAYTKQAIHRDIHLSYGDFGTLVSLFYFAYALMYVGGGRLMDLLGTRRGFLLIVVWWSVACAAHGVAQGLVMLGAARVMLGLAQGGVFPAGAKAVAEWFPARERATAMGMVNGGSSIGAVIAPPAIALVLCYARWPWVYYLCGAIGLLWTVFWLWEYYPPAKHPRLSDQERRQIDEVLSSASHPKTSVSWWRLLRLREVWGMVLGKAFCDAVWFTYTNWLPLYFADMRHFDNGQMGSITWIPYAASGVGSLVGGWWSSRLLHQGHSLNFSRKAILGACAAVMPCMCLVTRVPATWEIGLFSLAFFAHLAFSTIVISLPADLFPRGMVGSVVGLVGFGGSMGGMLFNWFAGFLMERLGPTAGYPTLFAIGSVFHLLGFGWILLTIRKVEPIPLAEPSSSPVLVSVEESS